MTTHRHARRALVTHFIAFVFALGWVVSVGSTTALAVCSGSIVHDAVGGNENAVGGATRLGDRANVLVNNFSSNQHEVWRAVALLQNGNNFLEAGWVLTVPLFSDQRQRPYKTWVNLGVAQEEIIVNVWFTSGTFHEFKVHDQNQDQSWSFAFDGNAMGNESMSMTAGLPITESERRCTDDSLKADIKNLDKINCENCSWINYEDVERYINTTNNWKFCKRSDTRYEVLQNC